MIQDQLIICGIDELFPLLDRGDVGAVITASRSDLGDLKPEDAARLRATVKEKKILHFRSGVFHPGLGVIDGENYPEEEFLELHVLEIENTLQKFDDFLSESGPKKLVVHCLQGSDRSAMLTLVYLIKQRGGPDHVDQALGDLYQLRPSAQLNDVDFYFEKYFGSDYPKVSGAINTYRSAISLWGFVGRKLAGGTLPRGYEDWKEDVDRYNSVVAPRFGMPLIGASKLG